MLRVLRVLRAACCVLRAACCVQGPVPLAAAGGGPELCAAPGHGRARVGGAVPGRQRPGRRALLPPGQVRGGGGGGGGARGVHTRGGVVCARRPRRVLPCHTRALPHTARRHPGRALVFVNAVSALRKLLGLPALALHAQQQQRQRLKVSWGGRARWVGEGHGRKGEGAGLRAPGERGGRGGEGGTGDAGARARGTRAEGCPGQPPPPAVQLVPSTCVHALRVLLPASPGLRHAAARTSLCWRIARPGTHTRRAHAPCAPRRRPDPRGGCSRRRAAPMRLLCVGFASVWTPRRRPSPSYRAHELPHSAWACKPNTRTGAQSRPPPAELHRVGPRRVCACPSPQALDRFKSHEQSVLVATDVAARGLDIRDVR